MQASGGKSNRSQGVRGAGEDTGGPQPDAVRHRDHMLARESTLNFAVAELARLKAVVKIAVGNPVVADPGAQVLMFCPDGHVLSATIHYNNKVRGTVPDASTVAQSLRGLPANKLDEHSCFREIDSHLVILKSTEQDLQVLESAPQLIGGVDEPVGPAVICKHGGDRADPAFGEASLEGIEQCNGIPDPQAWSYLASLLQPVRGHKGGSMISRLVDEFGAGVKSLNGINDASRDLIFFKVSIDAASIGQVKSSAQIQRQTESSSERKRLLACMETASGDPVATNETRSSGNVHVHPQEGIHGSAACRIGKLWSKAKEVA